VYETQSNLLTVLANDRRAQVQREAEIYRLMTERANLQFGPSRLTQARRFLARVLHTVADGLEPACSSCSPAAGR
jgi:hypothetical protein